MSSTFKFKHFVVEQNGASLKVGTDSMVLGSFIKSDDAERALDIGTGTGVLSLMVAQTHQNLQIDAIEIDDANFKLAEKNINNSPYFSRIKIINDDFFNHDFPNKYDLIFSNPPFFIDSLQSSFERKNEAKHFSLNDLSLFVLKLVSLLSEKGEIFIIVPYSNVCQWSDQFDSHGISLKQKISIFGKPEHLNRLILHYSKAKSILLEKELIIRDENGFYTKGYINLTKDFHGKKLTPQ